MKNFICLLVVFLLISCGSLAPFKERSKAVENINKAEAVEAAKYAYKDFNQSKNLLKEADTFIVSNKKSPANTKAKKLLDESIVLSRKAYLDSIGNKNEKPVKQVEAIEETDHQIESQRIPSQTEYVVRSRANKTDCLWRIATYDFIYNDGYKWRKIYLANKKTIKDPNLIYPGQKLIIPPLE